MSFFDRKHTLSLSLQIGGQRIENVALGDALQLAAMVMSIVASDRFTLDRTETTITVDTKPHGEQDAFAQSDYVSINSWQSP